MTEQNASAAAQSEDRLHRVELGLADFRLERAQAAAPPPNTAVEAVAEIAQRMAALEDRQAQTLKSAQDDIAKFIADSEHRFATLDGHPGVGDPALGKAFEALRISVEERILGIELRSVRTLEQVADTVAMLEERLMAGDIEPAAEKAAG